MIGVSVRKSELQRKIKATAQKDFRPVDQAFSGLIGTIKALLKANQPLPCSQGEESKDAVEEALFWALAWLAPY